MSCAKMDPALHRPQKPAWIKVRLPSNPVFFSTKALISDLRLHTVCESAQCPNRWECWSQGTATFMIAGDRCTRACGFCAVTTAKPFALEGDEPKRVAEAVRRMNLKHVVITAVARDDLKDGGADHFARTITAIRDMNPSIVVEVLVPDFHAQEWCIQTVDDLREAGCEVLTMGQYLRPTPKHLPVIDYIAPEQFSYYGDIARRKGFLYVASGPLVRSSYHAADFHPVVRR